MRIFWIFFILLFFSIDSASAELIPGFEPVWEKIELPPPKKNTDTIQLQEKKNSDQPLTKTSDCKWVVSRGRWVEEKTSFWDPPSKRWEPGKKEYICDEN